MAHLLLISIGPVQEFIASARRSRDLWFSSWVLSELAKTAAHALAADPENQLIFPAPDLTVNARALHPGSDLNVANKLLARIAAEPKTVAQAVEDAMCNRLHTLRDAAYHHVHDNWDTSAQRAVADQQIDDLLEYLWVALPLEQEADYRRRRSELEALLAVRKATRDFKPVTWGSAAPKSSLDGMRESVIPERAYPDRQDSDRDRTRKIEKLYRDYGAGQAERLSGVDLLKRHVERDLTVEEQPNVARFPSTSHIAALPLLARLTTADLATARAAWSGYWEVLQEYDRWLERIPRRFPPHPILGAYSGDILFEDRLAEMLEESGKAASDEDRKVRLTALRNALRTFLHDAADWEGPAPPYYALLRADGDRMGTVISQQKTLDGHRTLSQALDRFVSSVSGEPERSVRALVEQKYSGALVYAGGDDVLAFLPVHTVLDCAAELAALFSERLQGFTERVADSPSLSAGIVIAHHLTPLSDTMKLSQAAERAAKGVPGKNALAITISKRSGSDTTVAGTWVALYPRLTRLIELYSADDLAAGAAYELRDLAIRLWPGSVSKRLTLPDPLESLSLEAAAARSAAKTQQQRDLRAIMLLEAGRILARKEGGRGTRTLPKETVAELKGYIEQVAVEIDGRGADPTQLSEDAPLAQFADELIVAHELARAVALTHPPPASVTTVGGTPIAVEER